MSKFVMLEVRWVGRSIDCEGSFRRIAWQLPIIHCGD